MSQGFAHFSNLVNELGPKFRERAPKHDDEGSFVEENYSELKQHKFFSAAVPTDLGGGGLSHREVCELLKSLARYCPATALALSMHTHLVAANVWRHRHGMPAEALLRKVAAAELVLISTGAGDWLDSVGSARKVEGGYKVSASKRFCSGVLRGDLLVTSAPLEDSNGAAEVLHFPVPLRAPGVRVQNDWDTLGMRATGSHTVELEDVFVPEETVALRRPRGQWHGSWGVIIGVAPAIYMAPYVGLAERAVEIARSAAQSKADTLKLLALGELENELLLAQLAWQKMVDLCNDYQLEPNLNTSSQALGCKTLTANAVQRCVAKAIEVVGGSGLFRGVRLEQLFRDAQGGPFHLLSEKKQWLFSARVALGQTPTA